MKRLLIFAGFFCLTLSTVFGGNPERAGQAGATQLLINPWARSSSFNGINISNSNGIESVFTNPAGIATTRRTELVFSHTRWLVGTDISINSFGFSQSLRNAGTLGLYVMAFDLGEFIRTTTDCPDCDLGTFSPTYLNMGVSYAKKFTQKIYVGATLKVIHESIYDVGANGVAFDAGVQYRTNIGKEDSLHNDRFKIGISLKNVGPTMKFAGDGLTRRVNIDDRYTSAVSRDGEEFEMPSVLQMGISYDFYFGGGDHRISPVGAFVSNSFTNDQFGIGIEYKFKKYLMVRYSFLYEDGIFQDDERVTAFTGHAAGIGVEIPVKTGKESYSTFGLDYAYRTTDPFQGTHSIGVRIDL